MWYKYILWFTAFLCALLLALIVFGKIDWNNRYERLVNRIHKSSTGEKNCFVLDDCIDDLPVPVQNYFRHVIPDNNSYIQSAQFSQSGTFNLGGHAPNWKTLQATQDVRATSPAFIWNATVQMAPLIPVRVMDAYIDGTGMLEAKLLSTFTVMKAEAGPELDSGELMRYLAEAVWYPTALLPSDHIQWTAIDDYSALVTLTDGDQSVSMTYYFNERYEVERVYTDQRYRKVDDSYVKTPWTGYFSDYRDINGIRIPFKAKVEWNTTEGDLPYFRCRITEVEYHF